MTPSRSPAPNPAPSPRSADGREDPLLHDQRRARRPRADAALRRSSGDRRVAGVAGGIAAFTGARPATVRLLWAASLPLTGGVSGLGYPVLWALVPSDRGA